ncbi:MAG TPA: dihydroorotate dehydrogenase [Acidimicrobiales bacterium]|nr:dihydroorotate dehydrogenase [Acidimicrobiales bacterium]
MSRRGASVDLTTTIGTVELPNPVMTASGTAGHGAELAAYFDLAQLGAVVVKSLSADPWPGNAPPRLKPVAGGMLNSVGLQGPGVGAWLERDLPALEAAGARVVVSIWGRRVEEYARAAALLASASPAIVAIEVNVSCPNLDDGREMFARSPAATAAAVEAAGAARLPRWAKLSPGAANLVEVARAAVDAGAAALTLVNTLPGLAISADLRQLALGGGGGGLSGPALHAVALRAVSDVAAELPEVPIIGVGGVMSGLQAAEFLLAGARAVQVGTATLLDPRAPVRVLTELRRWCAARRVERVADLVGGARD